MYQYLWDAETGGLLLTSEISKFSKEPRPVYYRELTSLALTRTGLIPEMTPRQLCGQRPIIIFTVGAKLPPRRWFSVYQAGVDYY